MATGSALHQRACKLLGVNPALIRLVGPTERHKLESRAALLRLARAVAERRGYGAS